LLLKVIKMNVASIDLDSALLLSPIDVASIAIKIVTGRVVCCVNCDSKNRLCSPEIVQETRAILNHILSYCDYLGSIGQDGMSYLDLVKRWGADSTRGRGDYVLYNGWREAAEKGAFAIQPNQTPFGRKRLA
jgi:hypothetical protein